MSKNDPLDGSVSGTIGGGGKETGGPTDRPKAPDTPPVNPDDAASGRMAPDPLGAAVEPRSPRVSVDVEPVKRDVDDIERPER